MKIRRTSSGGSCWGAGKTSGVRGHRDGRRGSAPLELTLFLPIYAAALMCLFTTFSFARTRSHIETEARHQAWLQRAETRTSRPPLVGDGVSFALPGRILNGSPDPAAGLVQEEEAGDATIYLRTLNLVGDMKAEHTVYSDVWDYRRIPFPEQGQHPRLRLDERSRIFGMSDIGAFSALGSASGIGASVAGNLSQSLNNRKQELNREVRAATQTLRRKLQTLEQRLDRVESQLGEARRQEPIDTELVSSLEKELGDLSRERRRLEQQLAELKSANNHF